MEKKHISTWFYADRVGEESIYPNAMGALGAVSSTSSFQVIYWRCIIVFFSTSLRFNPSYQHILYTNLTFDEIPDIGEFSIKSFLKKHKIAVITLPLTYQTPVGYYHSFRNQFYIFDIMQHIATHDKDNGLYIVLDSDCVWIKPADAIFRDMKLYGSLNYRLNYDSSTKIHEVPKAAIKEMYEELDGKKLDQVPYYFGGEVFAATAHEVRKMVDVFRPMWQDMLARFADGRPKFNTESQALSYLYHRMGYKYETLDIYIKRIGTSHSNHTATKADFDLTIWHMHYEKKRGLVRMYKDAIDPQSKFWNLQLNEEFAQYYAPYLQIPTLSLIRKAEYIIRKPVGKIFKTLKKYIKPR